MRGLPDRLPLVLARSFGHHARSRCFALHLAQHQAPSTGKPAVNFRTAETRMTTNTKPPQAQFDPDRLAAFFNAIGVDQGHSLFAIEARLDAIATHWRQLRTPALGSRRRKQLIQYLRAVQKKRKRRLALEPTIQHQMLIAHYLRKKPNWDAARISSDIVELRLDLFWLDDEEAEHEADIQFLLNNSGKDYRKKLSQKLVVEPVLRLLKDNNVKPSRKLPLSRIAHALFDLFDIAPRDRVSDAAVTSAWRKLHRQKASSV